jgi:uncharacterized protein (TIGR03503 family)
MLRDLICTGGRLAAFLLLFGLLLSSHSFAADERVEKNNKPLPFDVRIIIDISGSMKQTDPKNLRIPALNLLLELMPEGTQAGIWTFGQYVNNLVPVAVVDERWREQAKKSALKITSLGLKTNLAGALNDAAWGLDAASGFQQSIILLTDGKVDMADRNDTAGKKTNTLERQKLMAQVLDKYRKAGANIHTLALSDLADKNLLQQIALETDGLYSQAESAEELMRAFLRAFDRAVPAEQVPMEDNTFVIDESINEFTALIFKSASSGQETALLTPDGEQYSELDHPENVRWHKDIRFDLITIKQPKAGIWVAEADLDESNRVTILSDLALSVEGIPATIFPGDKLDVAIKLVNEGEVVKKVEILRLTDMTMKVITASGREGSKVLSDPENPPADGIYHEGLYRLKELGSYQVDVIAEGRTFQRKRSFSMTMIQPVDISHQPDVEKGVYRIEVKALSDNLDIERSRVIAKIKSPDDNTIIQSVIFDAQMKAWVIEVDPAKGAGEYSVDLNVRGITQSGKSFKVKPEAIVFDLPIVSEALAAEKVMLDDVVESAVTDSEVADSEIVENREAVEGGEKDDIVNTEAEVEALIAEDIAPNIAMADASQVDKPAEDAIIENAEGMTEENMSAETDDEGLAWWIYLILVLLNVAVIGAGVWWFMFRKSNAGVDAQTSMETEGALADLEALEEDFSGDFDSLDEGNEEDIPQAVNPTAEAVGDASSLDASSADAATSETDSFDEDFSIDPDDDASTEVDTDEDSWGEFDSDKKE